MSFCGFFGQAKEMEKVCLDCAGVYGSHVRPSRKLHFFGDFSSLFSVLVPGAVFSTFVRRRGRQSLQNGSKKGDTPWPRTAALQDLRRSLQDLRRSLQDLCPKGRKVLKMRQNPPKV